MSEEKLYKLVEVAREAGVSATTIRRWLKNRKIPEPGKDRNGWRVWTPDEMQAVVELATQYEEPVHKRQAKLEFDDEEARAAGGSGS